MADVDFGVPPEIMAVKVGHYKTLRQQSVVWSKGVVLFGANGAGKTNFLEALAILMGTRETVRLAGRRLAEVQPGSLELLVRTSVDELPWAPNSALNPELQHFARAVGKGSGRLSRIPSDAAWWQAVGISGGNSFLDAFRDLNPPPAVVEYLALQCKRPILRYTLQDFAIEQSGEIRRRFARTLVGVRTDSALMSKTKYALRPVVRRLNLGPAGQGLPQHADPLSVVDLLPLPETDVPPARLEWLPNRRDWNEMTDYLRTEFRAALPPATELAEGLARLFDPDDLDADPRWWLHSVAVHQANTELAVTVPDVTVHPRGDVDADVFLTDSHRQQENHELSDDHKALEQLSAGQRRWADEALATAARGVAEFARRAAWQAAVLRGIKRAELASVIAPVENEIRPALESFDFWTSEAKNHLLDAVGSTLRAAAHRELQQWDDPGKRAIWEAVQSLSNVQPRLTIRVFDEPEAHLHPLAQRRTARALDQLCAADQNIVVASHSPHFLELATWRMVHVERHEGSSLLSALTSTDIRVGSAFAQDLGLTRGELLTSISLLLFVEGEHDQVILEHFYRERLHQAGVALARIRGTNNLINVAQLDFIDHHLDVPLAVLLDYTRLERIGRDIPDGELTTEERKLRELLRACEERERDLTPFGLHRPDISAYLSEEFIRGKPQPFPGWLPVLERFERLDDDRPSFKQWLQKEYGVNLRTTARITSLLNRMTAAGQGAHPDLENVVDDIIRLARTHR